MSSRRASESAMSAETSGADEAVNAESVADEEEEIETAEEGVSEGTAAAGKTLPVKTARGLLWGSAAFATAAFVVAAIFGAMWWSAASGEGAHIAKVREEVSRAASDAVKAFTELDYENPDEYFERQKAVATGNMRDQIEESEENFHEAIAEAETKVVSTVQDIAVSELNDHEGKAGLLVAVRNQVTQDEEQVSKPLRLEVQMTRVDNDGEQVWKLSDIGQVPVVGDGV